MTINLNSFYFKRCITEITKCFTSSQLARRANGFSRIVMRINSDDKKLTRLKTLDYEINNCRLTNYCGMVA